jgi:competence ComEA-like helix-hairpin-helix protein
MKSYFRELFAFTDRERNGTIVLLSLIAIMIVFISVQKNFVSMPKEDFSKFDQFIASLDSAENSDSISVTEKNNDDKNLSSPFPTVAEEAGTHSVFHSKELFNFNPNNLPEDDWVRLGLSPAQARCIKNYEAKGGKFLVKEDVKKMFVISAERYAELEPFIVLPEKNDRIDSAKNSVGKNQSPISNHQFPKVIELNTADSSDLISISGIGPAFAKRILVYRERLGGFYSTNQLTEIFGIDAQKFDEIKNSVKADSTYIRKININTAGVFEFRQFPYFSPSTANALVSYRKTHGNFKSVSAIKGCALITSELYTKIFPYLTI